MKSEGSKDLISVGEAARLKGVSTTAIYKAIKEERLVAVTVLGRVGLHRADIMRYEPVRYGNRAGAKGRGGRPKGVPMSPEAKERISQGQTRRWNKETSHG